MSIFAIEGTVPHCIAPVGTATARLTRNQDASDVIDPFQTWVLIAPYRSGVVSELAGIVARIAGATGWSSRLLAEVARTTHPTIQAIKRGREPERRPDIADALIKTAEVVDRVSQLVGDQVKLKSILSTSGRSGKTPVKLLAEGEYGKAYLEAIDLLGRRQAAGEMLKPTSIRRPRLDVRLINGDDSDDHDN